LRIIRFRSKSTFVHFKRKASPALIAVSLSIWRKHASRLLLPAKRGSNKHQTFVACYNFLIAVDLSDTPYA
jgi:hypothetical protein